MISEIKSANIRGSSKTTVLSDKVLVVGPNGSGKSNVVDAVAWVLGAQGPRVVRSTKMDDVIFAGSGGRPPRNMAEVALAIDNSDRTANAPYQDFETIEVSRRIEREAGSVYRINGRDVRQRDVQIASEGDELVKEQQRKQRTMSPEVEHEFGHNVATV